MDALSTVKASESRLLAAMLASDIAVLSELIDDRLVFTGPDGTVLTKELDLETHRSGLLKLTVLESLDTSFHSIENLVVSTCKVKLAGSFGDAEFEGMFAYTRVWLSSEGIWRVIAGHATPIG